MAHIISVAKSDFILGSLDVLRSSKNMYLLYKIFLIQRFLLILRILLGNLPAKKLILPLRMWNVFVVVI